MWRNLIDDVKDADDIEKIVNNYIEKGEGLETINKLRNIVDEDEIPEDKKCKIIKIFIQSGGVYFMGVIIILLVRLLIGINQLIRNVLNVGKC